MLECKYMPENQTATTELAHKFTIAKYCELLKRGENARADIADFLKNRLTERYITPMHVCDDRKHGFTIMAVSCLLIETLESFNCGWKDTKHDRSRKAFRNFFANNSQFSCFHDRTDDFYENVRSGILHQGETKGGWHIRREGGLFEPARKQINATKFHKGVNKALLKYCCDLKNAEWVCGGQWDKFLKKMKAVCDNCESDDSS